MVTQSLRAGWSRGRGPARDPAPRNCFKSFLQNFQLWFHQGWGSDPGSVPVAHVWSLLWLGSPRTWILLAHSHLPHRWAGHVARSHCSFPKGTFFSEPCLSLGIEFPGSFLTTFVVAHGCRQSCYCKCRFLKHFLAQMTNRYSPWLLPLLFIAFKKLFKSLTLWKASTVSLRLFPLCSQLHHHLCSWTWIVFLGISSVESKVQKKAYSEFLHGVLSSLCVKCCANKPHPVVYDICGLLLQPEVIMPTDSCGSARVNATPPLPRQYHPLS